MPNAGLLALLSLTVGVLSSTSLHGHTGMLQEVTPVTLDTTAATTTATTPATTHTVDTTEDNDTVPAFVPCSYDQGSNACNATHVKLWLAKEGPPCEPKYSTTQIVFKGQQRQQTPTWERQQIVPKILSPIPEENQVTEFQKARDNIDLVLTAFSTLCVGFGLAFIFVGMAHP